MQNNASNKFYRIAKLVLMLIIAAVLIIHITKIDPTVASGDLKITVKKVSTVSIYVSGSGVTLESSDKDYDVYSFTSGASVTFTAVNESRIFTNWDITKANTETVVNESTNQKNTLTLTESVDVTVGRRDATTDDRGKYMLDRYIINDENDLIALQDILAGDGDASDYAAFEVAMPGDDKKEEAIKKMASAYYLVANNFTVFTSDFKGIGTKGTPFNGVMCGLNSGNISSIFLTLSGVEGEDNEYGLFNYLGANAVIRNLELSTSIGVTAASSDPSGDKIIYAGGLAGHMNKSLLVDVIVKANMGISTKYSNVYAGGIAGEVTSGTGFESVGNVVYDGTGSSWLIKSEAAGRNIFAGYVAGMATSAYIEDITVNVTNSVMDLMNSAGSGDSQLACGNLFGYYSASSASLINDVNIIGSNGQILRTVCNFGDTFVGGLIGYADTSSASLTIGKTNFKVLGTKSTYLASTEGASSQANAYSGGICAYVEGFNLKVTNEFKFRKLSILIDDTSIVKFDYLFEGKYEFKSLNNGKVSGSSHGKVMSGGLIGYGYIDICGTSEKSTDLVLASPTSELLIEATQSASTSGGSDDVEYKNNEFVCPKDRTVAGSIYGDYSSNNAIQYMNIYTNNTTIQTVREIGAKSSGDLHTGGLLGYIDGKTIQNVNLYFNDCQLLVQSLSFEEAARNTNEGTNSAYLGGLVGETYNNCTIANINFAGFNTFDGSQIGTTTTIESVQNTIPGGGNYKGENYIGGLVGRMRYTEMKNCIYFGSEGSKDYIKMNGHESPDSAFCGGLVGMIRTARNGVKSSITNCEIINAYVYAAATNKNQDYGDPDIYVGGIVGATYIHDTNNSVDVEACAVINTDVYGLGNDYMAVYSGGIVGGATWQNNGLNIKDCYVTGGSVIANLEASSNVALRTAVESAAGGIVGSIIYQAVSSITNCSVIDVVIDSKANYTGSSFNNNLSSYAAGIAAFNSDSNSYTIKNSYSNALVTASTTLNSTNIQTTRTNVYALASNETISTDQGAGGTITNEVKIDSLTISGNTYNITWNGNTCYISRRRSNNNYYYVRVSQNGNKNPTLNTQESNNSNKTIFTLDESNNKLYWTSNNGTKYYLTYKNNSLGLSNKQSDGYSFVQEKTETVYKTYNNTYYLSKNVNDIDEKGSAVPSSGFAAVTSTPVNIYNSGSVSVAALNSLDGYGNKMLFVSHNDNFVVNRNISAEATVKCTDMTVYRSTLLDVWVNIKNGGDTEGFSVSPDKYYGSMEEANKKGWFLYDTVLINNGVTSNVDECDISTSTGLYKNDSNVIYDYSVSDKDTIVKNRNDAQDFIKNRYEHTVDAQSYVSEYTLRVYDDMLKLQMNLTFSSSAEYNIVIATDNKFTNKEDISTAISKYGNISFSGKDSSYELTFEPNEKIEKDYTFYIGFKIGDTNVMTKKYITVNLIHNQIKLVGVTYADYTPPLNYYLDKIGTNTEPYKVYTGSITKFIPVVTKSNDINEGKQYVLEEYIERYSYSLSTSNIGTVYSSGEFKASDTADNTGTITLTDKNDSNLKVSANIKTVGKYSVSFDVTGADYNALTYATSDTDFYMEHIIRQNYMGVPISFTIKAGGKTYNLVNSNEQYINDSNILIKEIYADGSISKNEITAWDPDAYGYVIYVSGVGGDITVHTEYHAAYKLTFELQSESFNPGYTKGYSLTFKVKAGETYKKFFGIPDGATYDETSGTYTIPSDEASQTQYNNSNYKKIRDWAIAGGIFGYVYTGFYMVDNANTIGQYSHSIDDLINNGSKVSASNTFYAKWTFLIELVNAPGTYIKTSFPSTFTQIYTENGFNGTIEIPINFNEGYVFTIEKEPGFIGEASVNAYCITGTADNKIITEITIEKYHDNMYLYFIPPEAIKGYLVIATSVSNSEIIVGENTSSVTEEILPEDGIATFKYIVNHKNTVDEENNPDQSYIYNYGLDINGDSVVSVEENSYNLNLAKKFKLTFEEQSYKNGQTTVIPRALEVGTIVEVYYSVYIEGALDKTKSVIGTYRVTEEDITSLDLKDFTLLDLETKAFDDTVIFKNFLGSYTSVSEVYFFVLTPPNGDNDNVNNEIQNYIISGGYYDATGGQYLTGVRNQKELVNEKDLGDVVQNVIRESSKETKIYSVTPSRDTSIKLEDNVYTFTDNKTFGIYDIILEQTEKSGTYISLKDDATQSIIKSSEIKFGIKELRLSLGYGLGKVRIYGTNNKGIEEIIGEIEVTDAVYSEYSIDFKPTNEKYFTKFRIDNVSTNEIRLNKISLVSNSNGIIYEGNISEFVHTGENQYTLLEEVTGDARHEGSKFMLAVQFSDSKGIVENINSTDKIPYIKINGLTDSNGDPITYKPYLSDKQGKCVAYFNLTDILETHNTSEISFTIICEGYTIYTYQLIETKNVYKPAMGEVRQTK